jgi:tetratricopeptide (TPR) repeat protein
MATLKFPTDFSMPYNVTFTLDENLREQPAQPAAMRQAVNWLVKQMGAMQGDNSALARLLSMHGTYARMLGELDAALESLERSTALQAELRDERLSFVNAIRMGQVYQFRKDFARADALLATATREAQNRAPLKPFLDRAHQCSGRNLFDQGRYEEALEHFTAALKLREQRNDAELTALARHCVNVTQARIAAQVGSSSALNA